MLDGLTAVLPRHGPLLPVVCVHTVMQHVAQSWVQRDGISQHQHLIETAVDADKVATTKPCGRLLKVCLATQLKTPTP